MHLKTDLNGLLNIYEDIFVFDTETTGLDKNFDEIIEVAIIRISRGISGPEIYEKCDYFIKLNGRSLSPRITELTSITDDILMNQGLVRSIAAKMFLDFLGKKEKLLIAHNANFDLNFLDSMLKKENLAIDWNNTDFIDTLSIFKDRHKYPHKLSDAIITYGLQETVQNSHRAIDDASATLLILDEMCREKGDVAKYINIFGYNPKYPLLEKDKFEKIHYFLQPYDPECKLYEIISENDWIRK